MAREHKQRRERKPRSESPRPEFPRTEFAQREPRLVASAAHGPAVTINRRAAERLRAGHLWVYRSDAETLVPRKGEESLVPGALVSVLDNRGIPLGSGIYSSASQIAVRMVGDQPALSRAAYIEEVRTRLKAALDLRD